MMVSEKSSEKISLEILCGGVWLAPPLLDEPELIRAMNAAAVLKAAIVKCGDLSFGEGAKIRLCVEGEEVFSGRVFTKARSKPEVIEIVAYDELRYLQNRDCCVLGGESVAAVIKKIAAAVNLSCGKMSDIDYICPLRVYDNRRYIDMISDILAEVLTKKSVNYVILAESGKISLKASRDMQENVLLDLGSFAKYCYRTTIDEGYANRVKLIYEDRRKSQRQEYLAEDKAAIEDLGVLQYVHRSASASEESQASAKAKLRELKQRSESLSVSGAIGDIAVRGGSIVWVRLNLGEKIVEAQALVKSARHYFRGGHCLMDLELDCSLF